MSTLFIFILVICKGKIKKFMKRKKIKIFIFIIIIIILTTLSLIPTSGIKTPGLNDKVLHFLAYIFLSCMADFLLNRKSVIIIGILFTYGVLIELIQFDRSDNIDLSEVNDELKVLEFVVEDLISFDSNVNLFKDLKNSIKNPDEDLKCGICHALECVDCKDSAFNCGSFCPECHRYFHQHCCAEWAKNQKDTPRTFFKCPVCFHLLKIPDSFKRTIE